MQLTDILNLFRFPHNVNIYKLKEGMISAEDIKGTSIRKGFKLTENQIDYLKKTRKFKLMVFRV